jgi:hypothetical protein
MVLVEAKVVDSIAASAASLQAAYGESEPDYSASMVRENNPDYGT